MSRLHDRLARRHQAGPTRAADLHPVDTPVQRFNTRAAILVTQAVGSMWCAYAFGLFDLVSLPAAIRGGVSTSVSWVAQTFLQLVLLSVIMVGQRVQSQAGDRRAEDTYEDGVAVMHGLVELHTKIDVLAQKQGVTFESVEDRDTR